MWSYSENIRPNAQRNWPNALTDPVPITLVVVSKLKRTNTCDNAVSVCKVSIHTAALGATSLCWSRWHSRCWLSVYSEYRRQTSAPSTLARAHTPPTQPVRTSSTTSHTRDTYSTSINTSLLTRWNCTTIYLLTYLITYIDGWIGRDGHCRTANINGVASVSKEFS